MKIKILQYENRSIPMIFCDLCEKAIDKDQRSEYLIPRLKNGDAGDPIVGHTACTEPYEKRKYAETGEVEFGNMSLGYLLAALIANHGIDIDRERKSMDALSQIA